MMDVIRTHVVVVDALVVVADLVDVPVPDDVVRVAVAVVGMD